jgi:hypothetical protein
MKNGLRAADVEALLREIRRYLACVDAFRSRPPEPKTKDKAGPDDA